MKLTIHATVNRGLGYEINYAAEHIGTVLRTLRSAQNLNRLEAGWLDETEECADAAALRTRGIAYAVDKDGNVATS